MKKRVISIMLTAVMMLSLFPCDLPFFKGLTGVSAATTEGTSKEVLDDLRIPSDDVNTGDSGSNPYSENTSTTINMFPRMELLVRDNSNNGDYAWDPDVTVYDYKLDPDLAVWHDEMDRIEEASRTVSSQIVSSTNSVAIDDDADGRKNTVVRIGAHHRYDDVDKREETDYYLIIEDDGYGTRHRRDIQLDFSGTPGVYHRGFEQLAELGIAAGDFDGDGRDEVAIGALDEVYIYKISNGYTAERIQRISMALFAKTQELDGLTINYPQIHLESGDLTNDNRDELIITAGYRNNKTKNEMIPKTTIWSQPKGSSSLSLKATFNHTWDYKEYNSGDTSDRANWIQSGAYGSTAVGDIDGDGANELVLGSYDLYHDNPGYTSCELNQQKALLAVVEYDPNSKTYNMGAGGVGQAVNTHPDLASGMWDCDSAQPIALECYNPYGTGHKDLIFVAGMVYEFKESSDDASYSGVTLSNGHSAANYGYKLLHQTGCIYARDDECYYGDKRDETDNIWIGTVAVGNFICDENGGEQIIFEHGRERDGENDYKHDLVIIHTDGNGNISSDWSCINNHRGNNGDRNIDFTAFDNDHDGAKMRFKSKAAYFSDPNVVAVLQAAPYFADLENLEPDYIEDGETVFGQSSGSGSSVTNGFSVTASAITGYKNETSFIGITRLGGTDFELEISASMGGEWESATEKTYSTEYTSNSLDDRVVLSMTPYIRYVYDMYVPEFKIPTYSEYTSKLNSLSGDEKEQYKEEINIARNKGYGWGSTVPAFWTEYIVCMPQQPRMSMVEVSIYDKMAEIHGFEKIKGNILKETVGDPRSYPATSNGFAEFDGGKDIVGEEAEIDTGNFIWVSKGGGTVTQSIETSESGSKAVTWGAGISTTLKSDGAGFVVGAGASAEYTGSYTSSDYSSTICSGTVAGLPNGATDLGYDFKWRFGQWKSKLNNKECVVLGYLVNDVSAPPYCPLNLTVKDTTDTTATLNWDHPSSRGQYYEVYLVTDNPSLPYYKLATVSNDVTEYTVEGLAPNTNYDFVMRSISTAQESAYTTPVTARTRYGADANVPKTDMLPDIYAVAGSDPTFELSATPAEGGTALTYQWQRLETEGNISNWTDIFGETGKVLTLNDVSKSMDGDMYRCTVAQFVDGNVAYVYSNAATLHVGAGATETTVTLSNDYGTATGSYQVAEHTAITVEREAYTTVDGVKYSLSKDGTDGYIMTLADSNSGTEYMYVPTDSGKTKLDDAITANTQEIQLTSTDVKALNTKSEFADENGTSTGISSDVIFTDEAGSIIVGEESVEYSKKYEDGSKAIYAYEEVLEEKDLEDNIISTTTETTYYYDEDTTDPDNEPVVVSGTVVGYNDGEVDYTFASRESIYVEAAETETTYTTQAVAGTPVTMTAEVESLSQGVVVTPKGTVEFTIVNNETGNKTKQRVNLPNASGRNTNSVSYTWTTSVSGNYVVSARYIESVELLGSVSNEEIYTAYAINSNDGTQEQKSLVFDCSDSIIIGETLDMKPTLNTVTVTDNGEKVENASNTATLLSAGDVEYSATLQYGADATDKYSFDDNTFQPTETGTYIVSAEYSYTEGTGDDEIVKTLSVSKTINVLSTDTDVQQQIYFAYSALTKYATDTGIVNPLTNPNAGASVEFRSSNEAVATVADDGTVTPVGAGTATITAVSKLTGLSDTQASYLLTIRKTPVTVTAPDITVSYGMTAEEVLEKAKLATPTVSGGLSVADITSRPIEYSTNYKAGDNVGRYPLVIENIESEKYEATVVNGNVIVEQKILSEDDFEVTAQNKVYNKQTDVKISAVVKDTAKISGDNVTVDITGEFETADAGENKKVNYEIISLGGTNFANYKIEGGKISGIAKADITKAPVTITTASKTTYIYDGMPKTVSVNAYVNNLIFTDFEVEYDRGILFPAVSEAKDAGEYDVDIVLNDSAANNYEIVGYTNKAKLIIVKGVQDAFSIDGIPDKVSYGDSVTVSAPDADGEITFEVVSGDAEISDDNIITFTGVGNVTVKATSVSENYEDKTVTKQINVQRRELNPLVTAVDRVYNGSVNVNAEVMFENIVSGDEDKLSASAKGLMINADAGDDKIVYISAISLDGEKKDYYVLSTQNIQTSVDISPLEITDFAFKAFDKSYDGSDEAEAEITEITGVLPSDSAKLGIIGSAAFEDADAFEDKTVTFTAHSLTGIAEENYVLGVSEAVATASIIPMDITFKAGTISFVYDETEKNVEVAATDNNGEVFEMYTVEYYDAEGNMMDSLPVEAGEYTVKFVLDDGNNYTAADTEVTMEILQASQEQISIIGLPGSIEYSDSFELEVIGGSGEGEITWLGDSAEIIVTADEENSAKATVTVNGSVDNPVTVSAVKSEDNNYVESNAEVTFVPSAKKVTFTLGDLLHVYDGNPKEVSVTPSVDDAEYTVTYNGMSSVPTDVGTYTVQLTGTGNYVGSATANLVISRAEMSQLDISLDDWTYGDKEKEPVYIDAPEGTTVEITYSTKDGRKPVNAGEYTVYATYSGANYETYVASDTFTIKKRTLTVKADNATRSYGEPNPIFTLTYSGYAEGENEENLLSVPIITSVATSDSPVKEGGYPIEASGGRADNYTFVYEDGVLDIVGASGGNFYISGANNSAYVGDIFTLRAYYNNFLPEVKWESSDESIATVTGNGKVMALKKGTVTITATITDDNYAEGISAEFELVVNAVNVNLTPGNLVVTYNGKVQGITLASDKAEFVPVLDGEGKNIEISYLLKTDPNVTEARNAGEYTVVYQITDPSYSGSGTAQMNINKATVELKAMDVEKVYGEENPEYTCAGLLGEDAENPEYIAKIRNKFTFSTEADKAGAKANAGVYPITMILNEGEALDDDQNYNFTLSQQMGSLTVKPKDLVIKVDDAQRSYGEKNADPVYSCEGFVNEETEKDMTKKPVFTYSADITEATEPGSYPNVITADGAECDNYVISYAYANGAEGALLTVNKAVVTVSGKAKKDNLTVTFDKAIAGLGKENFKIRANNTDVEFSEVKAGSNNKSYTLSGSFEKDITYSVTVILDEKNYELVGSPLQLKVTASSGSSGGGGGGGGGAISAEPVYCTIDFDTQGANVIDSVKVEKNDTVSEPSDVKKEGYVFGGWFKDKACTESYDFETKVTKSFTLYAKWTEETDKISDAEKTDMPTEKDEWINPFDDVRTDDWYYEAVGYSVQNNLFNGTTENLFEPDAVITRAMMVTVLYRAEGKPEITHQSTFEDVEEGSYYEDAVVWAEKNGIVKGYSDTKFGPDDNITREQIAAIIYRYAKYKEYDVEAGENTNILSYIDADEISDYAVESVQYVVGSRIMTGKTEETVNPLDNATRAEIAVILQRFIEGGQQEEE